MTDSQQDDIDDITTITDKNGNTILVAALNSMSERLVSSLSSLKTTMVNSFTDMQNTLGQLEVEEAGQRSDIEEGESSPKR